MWYLIVSVPDLCTLTCFDVYTVYVSGAVYPSTVIFNLYKHLIKQGLFMSKINWSKRKGERVVPLSINSHDQTQLNRVYDLKPSACLNYNSL